MRIVIDIPEEQFTTLNAKTQAEVKTVIDDELLVKAIKNGTPLPKGHGRLIDADELKSLSYEVLLDTDNPNRADGLSVCNGLVEDDIDLAPTIIEADKGAENE